MRIIEHRSFKWIILFFVQQKFEQTTLINTSHYNTSQSSILKSFTYHNTEYNNKWKQTRISIVVLSWSKIRRLLNLLNNITRTIKNRCNHHIIADEWHTCKKSKDLIYRWIFRRRRKKKKGVRHIRYASMRNNEDTNETIRDRLGKWFLIRPFAAFHLLFSPIMHKIGLGFFFSRK